MITLKIDAASQRPLQSSTLRVLVVAFGVHALANGAAPTMTELLVASGLYAGKEGCRYIGEGLKARKP